MSAIDRDPRSGLNSAVAAELRAERVAQDITLEELYQRSGLGRSTVHRALRAERLISIEALAAMSAALGVSPATILERAEKRMEAAPLPCWWSLVVGAGGWASCCGHDVLPLSSNDPGGCCHPRQPGAGDR